MIRRVLAWAPALAWAAVIFAVSHRPSVPVDLGSGRDKLAHFAAYALLGLLLAVGQRAGRLHPGWVVALGWAYALSDEWHQSFVPGRSPDVRDWVADAAGVVAGLLLSHLWRTARDRRPAGAAAESSS